MSKSCSSCDHFNPKRMACQRCQKPVKVPRPDSGACLYWKQIKPEPIAKSGLSTNDKSTL